MRRKCLINRDDIVPDTAELATEILRSRSEQRQIPLLTTRPGGLSLDQAYRVSALIEDARTRQGERSVGRKIGFTNRTIWKEFNVSAPIFGTMYDTTVRPLGAAFDASSLMEPRIEPEIAFQLAAPPRPGMTPAELIGCVSGVCAGFEMVQSIYKDWTFSGADTVAAFGLHGAFLHGPMRDLPPTERADWIARLSTFRTTLRRNATVADQGYATNVLGGGPLVALGHLVDLLAGMPDAVPLKAGDLVTTGTLTRALPVCPGEAWQARFNGLPLAAIEIELV